MAQVVNNKADPGKKPIPHYRLPTIVVTVVLLVLSLTLSLKLLPFAEDDAYIHFRIAENLAHHFAPYFNISEPVMSTSAFVWTCLLAVFAFFKLPLPLTVAVLNPILIVGGSLAWLALLNRLLGRRINWAAGALFQLVYVGLLTLSGTGLMETPFALLLVGLGFLFLSNGRHSGWIFLALAVFTRYEVSVFVGLYGLAWLFDKKPRRTKIREILFLVVPTLILVAVLFSFYSTVIPNTVIAKKLVYQLAGATTFDRVFYSVFPRGAYPFLGVVNSWESTQVKLFTFLAKAWQPALIGVTLLSIAVHPFKKLKRKEDWTGLMLLLGGLMLAGLYVLQKVLIFEWYVPIFSVPIFFGIAHFTMRSNDTAKEKGTARFSWRSLPVTVLIAMLCLNPLASLGVNTYAALVDPGKSPHADTGIRVQRYLEVGSLLGQLHPDWKLLTSEIGGLGYAFGGEIIDGAGLVTPRALAFHPMKVPEQRRSGRIGAIPAAFVGQEMPELIVSYEIFVKEFDALNYKDDYTRVSVPAVSREWAERTGISRVYLSDYLFIYIRNDVVTSADIDVLLDKLAND